MDGRIERPTHISPLFSYGQEKKEATQGWSAPALQKGYFIHSNTL